MASAHSPHTYYTPSTLHAPAHSSFMTASWTCLLLGSHRTSLVAQLVESLPAVLETQVQSLGQEDPLVSLPLGLALGSPIFPSGCEGKLGVALESLQGRRDLT